MMFRFQYVVLVVLFSSTLIFETVQGRAPTLKFQPNLISSSHGVVHMSQGLAEPKQVWNYVTVRPQAHMFYWLYYTTHASGYKERPLILWLQGGPGASGTGYGNFAEFGPLDTNLEPRNTTWLQTASLLFIDNPVGAGYSYVDDSSAYTTNNDEIAADLLTLMQNFVKTLPDFEEIPFYIFSESYGGKMTVTFSATLHNAISQGQIKMNFKGFAMGDSWISPVDSTNSWGPYLYTTSIVDKSGLDKINEAAKKIETLVQQGKFAEATMAWDEAETTVEAESGGVNFYNILDWSGQEMRHSTLAADLRTPIERLYDRHVRPMMGDDLNELMNGPIKRKLGIPENVTWGGQSGVVFAKLSGDFMKNVTATVNSLINTTQLKVIVYSGQLDLICDVVGTEAWFYRLDIAEKFSKIRKQSEVCDEHPIKCFYRKEVENVQFYWILEAGHMVPADNGSGALKMVNMIISS